MTDEPWWQTAFRQEYLQIYAHRDDGSAAKEAAAVAKMFDPATGPLLDACCGNGRHAAALRELGFDIVAFDFSRDLLHVAHQRKQIQGLLFQADVRFPSFKPCFAGITLFFTAFGYFDDQMNQEVLDRLAEHLLPGGLIMLDLPNPDILRAHLVPRSERNLEGGLHVVEERRLSGAQVIKDVCISVAGSVKRQYSEQVRLYSDAELSVLAKHAGLTMHAKWPSLLGPNEDQQRCVYWLQKPR